MYRTSYLSPVALLVAATQLARLLLQHLELSELPAPLELLDLVVERPDIELLYRIQ